MSTHVVTEFKTKPGRAEELVQILSHALPDSLAHDGCEGIALRRNQDDPTNIVSFTQWASRRHYDDYLAWRTAAGLTDEVGEMLVEPMTVKYFDEVVTVSR
jgi:quinol monooxygenase YgiN